MNAQRCRRRWRRTATAITALTVTALVSVAAAAPSSGTTPAASRSGGRLWGASHARVTPGTVAPRAGSVHYAIDVPVCGRPKNPYLARCFALRRVPVAKGTKGAYAYTTPDYQVGPAGGYTPADLARAYGFNPAIDRRNNIVGIVDWYDDPHALSDLDHFDATYGLPRETSRSFAKVNQAGRFSPLPRPDVETSGEIVLDIESVRAVCHTCRILLIEANSGTTANLAAAENLAARLGAAEISNSYGALEHKLPAAQNNAFNHPGVVITASTGDSGWYGWDVANGGKTKGPNGAQFPSSSPYVVSVGGTGLTLNANETRAHEFVWNENGADDSDGFGSGSRGAAGGGCSRIYAAPPWQSHHAGYAAAGCKGGRLNADISALADPQTGFDVYNTYVGRGTPVWGTSGGTSLASPLVAAMWALAGGSGGSAYPAASLYTNASVRPATLFDVRLGGNGFCAGDTSYNCAGAALQYSGRHTNNPNGLGGGVLDCTFPRDGSVVQKNPGFSPECNAVPGYDGASGLGTPNSVGLFTPTTAVLSITHTARPRVGRATAFAAHARQRVARTTVAGYVWYFGDGTSAKGGTARHTYKRAGTYLAQLIEIDSRHQYAITATRVRVTR